MKIPEKAVVSKRISIPIEVMFIVAAPLWCWLVVYRRRKETDWTFFRTIIVLTMPLYIFPILLLLSLLDFRNGYLSDQWFWDNELFSK
jgi:hypothetical protein